MKSNKYGVRPDECEHEWEDVTDDKLYDSAGRRIQWQCSKCGATARRTTLIDIYVSS